MRNTSKIIAAAALTLGLSQPALADQAETKGGVTVKTDDGRFEVKIGGRIHFDGNLVSEDEDAPFGSSAAPSQSGFYFRRIYLSLSGKAYGWKYKVEPDFAPNNQSGATSIAFQDVYLATDVGPGELQLGQRKPFRAMEELTSSNDLLMIERPFASASGGMLKAGSANGSAGAGSVGDREFQQGVFYHGAGDWFSWGLSVHSLRRDNTNGTEGIGESARFTAAPLMDGTTIVHVGVSYSAENPASSQNTATNQSIGAGGFAYAGRRGPSFNLGTTTGDVSTIGFEYANVFGPFFAQAEYMLQTQDAGSQAPVNADDQDITAYYVQASYFVTGESKPYKSADGVFGSPKPNSEAGAIEITGRYDIAKADDPGYTGSSCTAVTDTKCQITAVTLGLNYYVNPNVRFMLNYVMGEADKGATGKDKPETIAARFQMSW